MLRINSEMSIPSIRHKRCSVQGCNYEHQAGTKVSLFGIPLKNEDLTKAWRKAICRDKPFTKHCKICANHFKPSDISYTKTVSGIGGKGLIVLGTYRIPQLQPNAIPSINLPNQQISSTISENSMEISKTSNLQNDVSEDHIRVPAISSANIAMEIEKESLETISSDSISKWKPFHPAAENSNDSICNTSSNTCEPTILVTEGEEISMIAPYTFEELQELLDQNEKLTSWKNRLLQAENDPSRMALSCCKEICQFVNGNFEVSTLWKVILQDDFTLKVTYRGLPADTTDLGLENALESIEGFMNFIMFLDSLKPRSGLKLNLNALNLENSTVIKENNGTLRHANFPVNQQNQAVCKFVSSVSSTTQQKQFVLLQPQPQPQPQPKIQIQPQRISNYSGSDGIRRNFLRMKIQNLKKELYNKNRACKRWNQKVQEYKTQLSNRAKENTIENEMKRLDVRMQQQETVKMILNNAKANSKNGVRYSKEWISNCLQIYSKSPSSYQLMRELEFLPLPNHRTLARIRSLMNTTTTTATDTAT